MNFTDQIPNTGIFLYFYTDQNIIYCLHLRFLPNLRSWNKVNEYYINLFLL